MKERKGRMDKANALGTLLKFCKVAREGIDLALNFLVASLFSPVRFLLLQPN